MKLTEPPQAGQSQPLELMGTEQDQLSLMGMVNTEGDLS